MNARANVEWQNGDFFAAIADALNIPRDHVLATVRDGGVVRALYTTPAAPDFVYGRPLVTIDGQLTPVARTRYVGTVREVLELGRLDEHLREIFGPPSEPEG